MSAFLDSPYFLAGLLMLAFGCGVFLGWKVRDWMRDEPRRALGPEDANFVNEDGSLQDAMDDD